MILAWGAKVSPEFRQRVIGLCINIGIPDPSWLMACMAFETGRTFDPAKRNPVSNATGLIQFMPLTAVGMGTSIDELAKKSAVAQLEDVFKYFQPYTGRIKTLEDCYMAILWPSAVGEPNEYKLFGEGSKAYLQNKGLDVDADGVITKAEAASYVVNALKEGLRPENATEIKLSTEAEAVRPENALPAPTPIPAKVPTMALDPRQFLGPIMSLIPGLNAIPGLAAIINAIPLGGAAGGSAHADDYVPLVKTVVDTFTQAVNAANPGGVVNEQQAIQVATEKPEVRAAASQAVLTQPDIAERLAKLAPTLDKIASYDVAENAARIAGRASATAAQQAAAATAKFIAMHVARQSWVSLGGVVFLLCVALIARGIWKDNVPDLTVGLIGILGAVVNQVSQALSAIIAHFYDGTPASNATAMARDVVEETRAAKAKPTA